MWFSAVNRDTVVEVPVGPGPSVGMLVLWPATLFHAMLPVLAPPQRNPVLMVSVRTRVRR